MPPESPLAPNIYHDRNSPHSVPPNDDAGAQFVLESKGEWWHAGYHLTTAIVGPTLLTLPYVFRGLGWGLGFFCLTAMGLVTFYAYYLMSLVLDHCETQGRRHIRFRELAADVLGSGWMFYFVITIQTAINTGIGIGAILLGGQCIQLMYSSLSPNGSLVLYQFIAMVTVAMIILAQIPSFHALRHINLGSLILCLGYSFLVVGACINAGSGWMFYFVITIQTAINTGIGIGAILLGGQCIQLMYSSLSPNGSLVLYQFIAMVTVVMIILAQIPSFHALRHINLGSLILCLGYSFLVVGACINAGISKNAPERHYSLESADATRVFNAFTSISIIAAIFGNGILPEIQVTSHSNVIYKSRLIVSGISSRCESPDTVSFY